MLPPLISFGQKSLFWDFSVQPLCPLCLRGWWIPSKPHHGDTEDTEVAQRERYRDFLCKALWFVSTHPSEQTATILFRLHPVSTAPLTTALLRSRHALLWVSR